MSASSDGDGQMKTVEIHHGADSCILVLIEGAEPSSLTHAVAAKFHLGHHPFYFTFPGSDDVVPLSSWLPTGRQLILHVCGHSCHGHHGHHGHHYHHQGHFPVHGHRHFSHSPPPIHEPEIPPAPPPSSGVTSTHTSLTDPLLAGSWKDHREEPGAAEVDERRAVQMVEAGETNRDLSAELERRLYDIVEGESSKAELPRATLITPEIGSRHSLSSYEAHESAMEATAANIEESARTIDRFSRLSCELANERTLLAWVRTGLAAIRTVFPFYGLMSGTSEWTWRLTVIAAQIAMMTVVLFAGISGTVRYEKVKKALRLHDPPQEFGRVSVWWFNGLVGITYVAIAIGIYTLNWDR